MVKQLITAVILLLIQNISKVIHYACVIFDFTMLAQYSSQNDKTLFYMKHALYRLDKTKIAFKNHHLIKVKLFQPTFNYPKLHAITHLIKYI